MVSQRNINEAEFVQVRKPWIDVERIKRKKLNIIISKPVGYDQNPTRWNVIWPEGVEEIWDGEREINEDEIPFSFDIKNKQIIRFTENSRLVKNKISYIGKYRQGTIAMVMNFKRILFIIIIFKRGGIGVTQKLRHIKGNAHYPVYLFCTESGNMTAPVWIQTMVLLQNATKNMRGCRQV